MKNKTDRMNRKHLCKKNALPLRGMALVLCLVLLLPSLFACTIPEEGTTPAATTPAETTTVTTSAATTTLDAAVLEANIKAAYYKTYPHAEGVELDVVIHEQFGDVFVVEATQDATVLDLEYEIIANREFLYDTEARLDVYRADGDGTLMPLAEAHAAGLLNDEHIRTLYDAFRAANQALYDEYSTEKWLLPDDVERHIYVHYDRICIYIRKFALAETYTTEDFASIGCTNIECYLDDSYPYILVYFPETDWESSDTTAVPSQYFNGREYTSVDSPRVSEDSKYS